MVFNLKEMKACLIDELFASSSPYQRIYIVEGMGVSAFRIDIEKFTLSKLKIN